MDGKRDLVSVGMMCYLSWLVPVYNWPSTAPLLFPLELLSSLGLSSLSLSLSLYVHLKHMHVHTHIDIYIPSSKISTKVGGGGVARKGGDNLTLYFLREKNKEAKQQMERDTLNLCLPMLYTHTSVLWRRRRNKEALKSEGEPEKEEEGKEIGRVVI